MAMRREMTGTATDEAPSKDSPCETAYPILRTDSRQRSQSASVRTVLFTRGGKPARRRARSASGFQAAIALPLLVVCEGRRRPKWPRKRTPSVFSMRSTKTTSGPSGTEKFTVRPVLTASWRRVGRATWRSSLRARASAPSS